MIMVVHLLLIVILSSVSFVSAVEDEARNEINSPEISLRIPTRSSSEHDVQNIPTKKRTPNRTRPSSKYTPITDNKDEKSHIKTPSNQPQQTSGKRPAGYYSIEQHAIRIAKSPRFCNSIGGQTTYEERLRLAKEKLSSKKFKDNQNFRKKQKELGNKPKNYHTIYTSTKEGIIDKMTVHYLAEKNNIFTHEKARQKAQQWYQDRENLRTKRRHASKAKRKELDK